MAKKKKSKKTSQRRRRVSGVALNAKNPLVQYGAIAAGYFLGDKINEKLATVTGTLDPKIVAAMEAAAGYLVRSKVKGAAGAIAGGVLMGAGIKGGLKAFGVISGMPVVSGTKMINGYKDLRTINGLPAPVRRVAGAVAPGLSNSVSVISGVDNYSSYTDRD